MESHEDDIFFLPRKFDDVVPSTPSSSSSSSSGIEEVKFGRVGKGKRTNPSILQDKPNRRPRGGLKEDSKKLQDNCSEDALDRTKKFHEFEGLLLKLEENRRRFKLLDEVDAAPCDPLDNSVQLASTNSENLDNIIVKLQSASLKEVFCIRRSTTMRTLLMACCKRWGLSESNTVLYFDGRVVSSDSTAESLELENDDLIDVVCNG